MPTGYTAKIADGMTFKEYALGCARAFGACIEMRDDPSDATIPDSFKPHDYHERALFDSKKELAHIQSMTDSECDQAAEKEYQDSIVYHEQGLRKDSELRSKYESVLRQVEAYTPPSPDHVEFKKFMRQQIEESIDFDCGAYHTSALNQSVRLSGAEWRAKHIERHKQEIEYHAKEQQKENERAASRTKWIQQLKQSLNGVHLL